MKELSRLKRRAQGVLPYEIEEVGGACRITSDAGLSAAGGWRKRIERRGRRRRFGGG